jgi:tetratricopeptide (TPR) repeat protein
LSGKLSAFTLAISFFVMMAIPSTAAAQSVTTYREAVDALYNLDFSIAEAGFNNLIQQDQGNPQYWNGLASTIWLKILYDQQKLNSDSYSGSSIGGSSSRDTVDPDQERRLRQTVATAITKAQAILKKNRNDIRALYAIGVANSTLAAFEGIAKRSYTSALSNAKSARNYHLQVLKLDPNFHDANLSIGTYDYGIGVIPRFWRFFLGIFGVSGAGKEEGIRKLQLAAAKGNYASTDAKIILIVFYNREKRYEESLKLIDELLAKYPRNFQLELEKAAVYDKMKNFNASLVVYRHILGKIEAKQDGYERLREERVYFGMGQSNVYSLQLDNAVNSFNHVVRSANAFPGEKGEAHLWLGKIYDSRNERPKAVEQYNAVLKLDCSDETKDAAKQYLRKPFK